MIIYVYSVYIYIYSVYIYTYIHTFVRVHTYYILYIISYMCVCIYIYMFFNYTCGIFPDQGLKFSPFSSIPGFRLELCIVSSWCVELRCGHAWMKNLVRGVFTVGGMIDSQLDQKSSTNLADWSHFTWIAWWFWRAFCSSPSSGSVWSWNNVSPFRLPYIEAKYG